MARQLRLNFPDAFYHIMSRGFRRDKIFKNIEDKEMFLKKLNETIQKFNFKILSYCIMDNHYHLFLTTPDGNLSEGMHYLNTSYSNWYKAKYKLAGGVFQGRYKAILVDKDNYSLQLSAYIHLNPLKAGIVRQLKDYKWSSYPDYLSIRKPLIMNLDTIFILKQLSDNQKKSINQYEKYVLKQKSNNVLGNLDSTSLGNKEFIERIRTKIKNYGYNKEITETHAAASSPFTYDQVIDLLISKYKIKKESIFTKSKQNKYKRIAIYLLKNYTNMKLKEIGAQFNLDYVSVSVVDRRIKEKINSDRELKAEVKIIISDLKNENEK